MISQDDANALIDGLLELNGRMQVVEDTQPDILDALVDMRDSFVDVRALDDQLNTIRLALSDLATRVSELNRLPNAQNLRGEKLGDRMTEIENELKQQQGYIQQTLSVIADGMIEVKGQIANPLAKITAIDHLRDLARQRSR